MAATTAPIMRLQDEAANQSTELATAYQSSQAIAFEQAAFIMAERHPRNRDVVRQLLLHECERPSFAETAIYARPVGGGKVARGLSIRYTEAALNIWGNNRTKRFVTLDDAQRRKILIVVSDLETNTHFESEIVIEKTVERRGTKPGQKVYGSRQNSNGDLVYLVDATEDDLHTKESALASKVIRQNGLRIIPGWLQDECLAAIQRTMKEKIKADPDHEKNKVIDAFADIGIRVTDLQAFLGSTSLDTLTPADLIALREVYQAIADGETNWREVMEQREAARGASATASDDKATGKGVEKLKTKLGQKESAGASAQAQRPVQAQPGEQEAAPKPAVAATAQKAEPETAAGLQQGSKETVEQSEPAQQTLEAVVRPATAVEVAEAQKPAAAEQQIDTARFTAMVQEVEQRKQNITAEAKAKAKAAKKPIPEPRPYVLASLMYKDEESGQEAPLPVFVWSNHLREAFLALAGKQVDITAERRVKNAGTDQETAFYTVIELHAIDGKTVEFDGSKFVERK